MWSIGGPEPYSDYMSLSNIVSLALRFIETPE